jgi:hypothetical protein
MFNYLYKQIMKKLFFGIAFMLVGSISFAYPSKPLEKVSETSFEHLPVENSNHCKSSYNIFSLLNKQVLEDCTVTTDLKITKDGKTTTIKGTMTVEGTSCADLLKKLIS